MSTTEMSLEERLESLDRKLDFVVGQMKEYERKQREIRELKEDMCNP
jgi:tetrahydromethanopterin S-methyltransferase subunit G